MERIAPTATDERPTASARPIIETNATARTGTPRAIATSGDSELNSSGRSTAAVVTSDTMPRTATRPSVEVVVAKIEPKSTSWLVFGAFWLVATR